MQFKRLHCHLLLLAFGELKGASSAGVGGRRRAIPCPRAADRSTAHTSCRHFQPGRNHLWVCNRSDSGPGKARWPMIAGGGNPYCLTGHCSIVRCAHYCNEVFRCHTRSHSCRIARVLWWCCIVQAQLFLQTCEIWYVAGWRKTGQKLSRDLDVTCLSSLSGRHPALQRLVQRMLAPCPVDRPTARDILISIATALQPSTVEAELRVAEPTQGCPQPDAGTNTYQSSSPVPWGVWYLVTCCLYLSQYTRVMCCN